MHVFCIVSVYVCIVSLLWLAFEVLDGRLMAVQEQDIIVPLDVRSESGSILAWYDNREANHHSPRIDGCIHIVSPTSVAFQTQRRRCNPQARSAVASGASFRNGGGTWWSRCQKKNVPERSGIFFGVPDFPSKPLRVYAQGTNLRNGQRVHESLINAGCMSVAIVRSDLSPRKGALISER